MDYNVECYFRLITYISFFAAIFRIHATEN